MDMVTQRVLALLEDDTMGAPDAKPTVAHVQDRMLTDTREHPIGDVSGRMAPPKGDKAGIGFDTKPTPEDKPAVPNGMTDEMLRSLPNATGRMARMKMK